MDANRECIEQGYCRPRHKAHKNTRDWCKGRVGVPHAYLYEPYDRFKHYGRRGRWLYESLVCFGCGRVKRKMFARVTCVHCGAHKRTVYEFCRVHPKTGQLLYRGRSAWACDCPDNRHPGYF
jgi:hypothetical protein